MAARRKCGARLKSLNRDSEAIILSDLDRLVDREYIDERNPNLWRAIPYQTPEIAGTMLGQGGGCEPVPLTIRLGVNGLYRIWLATTGFFVTEIRVRLSRDLCYQTITSPPKNEWEKERAAALKSVVCEVLWKEADLSGQDLILEGFRNPEFFPAALAYIRLEPVQRTQVKVKKKIPYPLAITNDGHGIFGERPHSRPEDLLESFENIPAENCMRILIWGAGNADICNYPTKVGNFHIAEDSQRHFEHIFYRNMRLWRKQGWDSLKLVSEYARKRGWEFQAYIRMEAFAAQFPMDNLVRSDFFQQHPDYHCLDREGQRVGRLSYAYPEVQEHMLSLVREIAAYDPDGVCLCFVRGIPLVLYEPIMVEGFKKRHGIDPRQLEEYDQRWMDYQAEVINPFMRRVKSVLASWQRLSVIVPGNEIDCKRWGLDVACWVKEGIVNDLFPVGQSFNQQDVHYDDPENLDFKYFKELLGRKDIRLIPMLYPWDKFNKDYPGWRKLICSFLADGADGYAVWDATESLTFSRVADIGYQGKSKTVPPKVKFRKIKLLSINGVRMDRYHYFEVV